MSRLSTLLSLALLAGVALAAQPRSNADGAVHNSLVRNAQPNGDAASHPGGSGNRDSRTQCDNAIVLECNTTFNGQSSLSQNGDTWQAYCFSGETGPEIIHRIDHAGGLLNLTLSSSDNNQLDLILLGDCDPFNCISMPWFVGSFETISENLAAGTYYAVVDAYSWNGQPFTYTLDTVCPGNVDLCADAFQLECGTTVTGTSGAAQNGNTWTTYCFSGESGPESIYRLEHPGGPLNLELSSTSSNQLDLILLGSCDPQGCLAMPWLVGSNESISDIYPAGTYYVVVDAYSWNGLPYTFQLSATCPGEADYCAAAIPLGCNTVVTGSSAISQNGNLWSQYTYVNESGPEVLYVINHPGGLLSAHLYSADSYQLDLILLGSCDPSDVLAMPWIAGSNESISGEYPAGTYYLVVDAFGWNGQPFTYTLVSGPCGAQAIDCHHTTSSVVLALPDWLGVAQSYYQLFVPTQAALLEQVTLHVNTDLYPDHDGTLTLSVLHSDESFQPTVLMGSLSFPTSALGEGYAFFDMSSLGYVLQPDQAFHIGLSFTGDTPGDALGFYAGEANGGYEGYSTFFDGSTYDGWWTNGSVWFDELNLCIGTGPVPCLPEALGVTRNGNDIVLGWTATSGQIRIEASTDAYGVYTPLATVPAAGGTWTDVDALNSGRMFYRGVRLCD